MRVGFGSDHCLVGPKISQPEPSRDPGLAMQSSAQLVQSHFELAAGNKNFVQQLASPGHGVLVQYTLGSLGL